MRCGQYLRYSKPLANLWFGRKIQKLEEPQIKGFRPLIQLQCRTHEFKEESRTEDKGLPKSAAGRESDPDPDEDPRWTRPGDGAQRNCGIIYSSYRKAGGSLDSFCLSAFPY